MSDKALKIILIVDDDPVNLAVMSKIIANHYRVQAVNSGAKCLEVANSEPCPDLILLDIQMPEMNGYQVLKELKQNPATKHIPIIFVTASQTTEDEEKGLKLGAVDFFVKPIRPVILQARIKTQLLIKHAENTLRDKNKSLETKVSDNEQRFKHVIEAVPAAIYETSLPELKIFFYCSKIDESTEFNHQQFNQGMVNWYEQIHPEDKGQIKQQLLNLTQKHETTFQLEYRMFHKDKGTIVWFEDNGTIEYDSTGEAQRIFGSLIKINDRKAAEQKLQESFEATIKAVSQALGKRDPYTATHQSNCARIAKAIAEQLKFDTKMVNGIYQAAAIHDIGKIYLPSEILNKPSRLSDAEFGLIKTHAQVGYDIIKDVKFPWPIADAILQHHERLDGSGYPNALKKKEICIEAKVLAVADVVDAMSSDRPYRKGLGIGAALSELELNRGKYYDTKIVDACLTLFREKNFSIQDD